MRRRPHYGAAGSTHALVAARRRGGFARTRRPGTGSAGTPTTVGAVQAAASDATWTRQDLEDLWERHGGSLYALACALLGDEAAAAQAVTLAMTDLGRSAPYASTSDARRSLARRVYWRSQELADETTTAPQLPPAMVRLDQLAQLQRACLALCMFGGQTHREAAGLLGVPPATVAGLLTSGLREVGRQAAREPAHRRVS